MNTKHSNYTLIIFFFFSVFNSFELIILPANSETKPLIEAAKNVEFSSQKEEPLKEEVEYLNNDTYIIGPGDVLSLSLFDAPEFSGEYKVLNDGSAPFPLIGNIFIRHLTLNQASKLIKEKYSEQLLRPELHLSIKAARPIKVSIIGEIERPGLYSLTTNEEPSLEGTQIVNSGLPTVVDAIQKAGGITQSANLREVIITRRLPGIDNQYKRTNINLLDLIMHGNHNQNLFLFDGDVIELKTASAVSKESMAIAQINLSPKTINVTVIGQVSEPGRKIVMANTPIIQAILLAGGPIDWKSNKNDVELIRINRNGSATKRKYKINLSEGVSEFKNPPLKDQDIVYVKPSGLQKISSGLGAITEPITPIISGLSLIKLLGN